MMLELKVKGREKTTNKPIQDKNIGLSQNIHIYLLLHDEGCPKSSLLYFIRINLSRNMD